eukprot:TRINITY_DN5892_c1_g1_i1.p1 TRINITY_DN5892_c1_g1~~TRINITY_DN5892_c1_g1_i1.p1  ORF type:complete len:245 (+),score=56.58 TRINITY_DN5892_c1_g1_i1:198-932(+)
MAFSKSRRPELRQQLTHELQSSEECGLCALRNVLRPYRDAGAELPTWELLASEAAELERGEALLTGERHIRKEKLACGPCVPSLPSWCHFPFPWWREKEDLDERARADSAGNFGVEVLMLVAAKQRVSGCPLALDYWSGRHRDSTAGQEMGFILGSGDHWWCVRPCGVGAASWEEVDSMEDASTRVWPSIEALREHLASCNDTVLVLHALDEEESPARSSFAEDAKSSEGLVSGAIADCFALRP